PLTVDAAHGLLANDSDADGDPITAALIVPPQHGTMTLHADGSFAYVADPGFIGLDTFHYCVSDGTSIDPEGVIFVHTAFASNGTDLFIKYQVTDDVGPFNISLYASPDGVTLRDLMETVAAMHTTAATRP